MSENPLIRLAVEHKGIARLCHFTQSRKLAHILSDKFDGIWSTAWLREIAPDLLDQTDPIRYDRHKNHICCSIEYPNTWYLTRVHDKDPLFREWVVLFLHPSLLWRENSLFCPRNAAAEGGELIEGGYMGFIKLYDAECIGAHNEVFRRPAKMLECCPTDGQAEVLVSEHIPRSDILGVAVPTDEQARIEIERLSFLPDTARLDWYVAPDLFDTKWSALVRQGRRPEEKLVQNPSE